MDVMADSDAKNVIQLVLAAKGGNWDEVFTILGNKPNLINCDGSVTTIKLRLMNPLH